MGAASIEVVPTFPGWRRQVRQEVAGPHMGRFGEEGGSAVSSGFDRGTGRLRGVIGGLVKYGTGALVGMGVAAGGMGLKTAAGMETAEIAFTTMLGSGKEAKSFLGDLSDFAAKTPFELAGLQTSAQSLISIGVEAEDVIPIMTTLGNVTAGMGTGEEGIRRATVALQQMNAAQRISAEDLNQLRDAGIPVYDLLASATGKSKEEIVELARTGKLGKEELDQLMNALGSGKGLERFNGMMEKQSVSLAGLWSTLKDTFSVGMAEAITPLIPLVKDGLGGAIGIVEGAVPRLQAGVQWLIGKAPAAAAGFHQVREGAQGLYDLVVKGDYTGALRKAFGWEEDNGTVAWLLDVRQTAITTWAELTGGINALGHAWTHNSGVVTSSGFAGYMEQLGFWARDTFDELTGGVKAFSSAWSANDGQVTSSGFAGYLERAGYWARQAFDYLRDTGIPAVRDLFAGIGSAASSGQLTPLTDGLSQLGILVKDVVAVLPAMKPTLDIASAGFGWMAENVDLVAAALPYLIAGFVAYKGVQAANNVIGRNSVIGYGMQLASTLSLTASNYALASSQRAVNASQVTSNATANTGLLTRVRMTAATVAGTVAETAKTVATKAATIATKALNLVLANNPLGWVLKGVMLLVGGLTTLYLTNEDFRVLVDNVWAGFKSAVGSAVTWFQENAWPVLQNVLQWVGEKATWLWKEVITPAWSGIQTQVSKAVLWVRDEGYPAFRNAMQQVGDKATWLWEEVITPAWSGIQSAVSTSVVWIRDEGYPAFRNAMQWVGDKAMWLWEEVITPAWSGIQSAVRTSVVWVRDEGYPAFRNAMQWVGDKATWLWEEAIIPAFDGISSAISTGWDTASGIFDEFRAGITKVKDAFSTAKSGISTAWGTLARVVATPINATIGFVNDAFIGGLNWLFDKIDGIPGVDLSWRISPIPLVDIPVGQVGDTARGTGGRGLLRGKGGTIPGSSPSKTADNIPLWATAGEFMQPVDAVRYYGGRVMEALRRRLIPREMFQGLAVGGPVKWTPFQQRIKDTRELWVRDYAPGWSIPSAAAGWNNITDLIVRAGQAPSTPSGQTTGQQGNAAAIEFEPGDNSLGRAYMASGAIYLNKLRDLNDTQRRSTAVHEVGHLLGMLHPAGDSVNSVMGQAWQRGEINNPTASDKSLVKSLYPLLTQKAVTHKAEEASAQNPFQWLWGKITGVVGDPIQWIRDKVSGLLSGIGSSWPAVAAKSGLGGVGGHVLGWLKSRLLNEPAPPAARTMSSMTPAAITRLVHTVAPGARMTSGFRPGARTRSNYISGHALNEAADYVSGNMLRDFNAVKDLRPWREGYFSPAGGGQRKYGRPYNTLGTPAHDDHFDHFHLRAAKGGLIPPPRRGEVNDPRLLRPVSYDRGGPLPPGDTWVRNRHRQAEWVTPPGARTGPMIEKLEVNGLDPENSRDVLDDLVMVLHDVRRGSLHERQTADV